MVFTQCFDTSRKSRSPERKISTFARPQRGTVHLRALNNCHQQIQILSIIIRDFQIKADNEFRQGQYAHWPSDGPVRCQMLWNRWYDSGWGGWSVSDQTFWQQFVSITQQKIDIQTAFMASSIIKVSYDSEKLGSFVFQPAECHSVQISWYSFCRLWTWLWKRTL